MTQLAAAVAFLLVDWFVLEHTFYVLEHLQLIERIKDLLVALGVGVADYLDYFLVKQRQEDTAEAQDEAINCHCVASP